MNHLDEKSPWFVEPGHFGDSPDNIIVIENFIDTEDLIAIQKFCPTIDEWNNEKESVFAEDGTCLYNADYWNDRQCSSEILKRLNTDIWLIIDKYIDKMQIEIETRFKCTVSRRPPVIMKWRPGIEQRPHADKQLNDGNPNAFVDYDINSLFYYNDDFGGGELYYPQHDICIKPKPGLAVIHPGDVNYLHGVSMITSGERYTTPSFYTVKEFK
jgi:hypothetical protein